MNETGSTFDPIPVGLAAAGAVDESVSAAYDGYAPKMYGLALAATHDPEAAADITQEAFVRLLTEARRGRYPDDPGAWLYRVTSNLILSRGRRLSVATRFARRLVSPEPNVDTPERIALGNEGRHAIDAALGRLPLVQRTALLMAAQGLTSQQIADHIGRSNGATRTLLFRARRELRSHLEMEGPRR